MPKHPSDYNLLGLCRSGEGGPSALGGCAFDAQEADAARAHVAAGCRLCEQKLDGYRAMLAALSAPPLHTAPESWVQKALFRLHEAEARSAPEMARPAAKLRLAAAASSQKIRQLLEEFQAHLVLDSFSEMALTGIRGAASDLPRQLLYESALGQVHLQIGRAPHQRLSLEGQVLPAEGVPGPAGGRAVLLTPGRPTARKISSTGEFSFRAIPSGEVHLRIEWGARALALGPLPVDPTLDP